MASPVRKRALSRAQNDATVRYGPEVSALGQLLRQAQQDYEQGVTAARNSSRGVQQTIGQTIPQMAHVYGEAQQAAGRARSGQVADFAALGPAADRFKAAAIQERQGQISRTGLERAQAVGGLQQQLVQTRAGEGAQINNLQNVRNRAVGTVRDRLVDLSREQGAFTQGRVDDLIQEAVGQKAAQQAAAQAAQDKADARATQLITHHINPATGTYDPALAPPPKPVKPAAKKKPQYGVGSLSQPQESAIIDKVSNARSWIETLSDAGWKSGDIRKVLATGGQIGPDKNGKTLQVPKFSNDWVNAGYDLHEFDGLSPANIAALHKRGLHIPSKWRTPRKKKAQPVPVNVSPTNPFTGGDPLLGG